MAGHWHPNTFDVFHWKSPHWFGAEFGVAALRYEALWLGPAMSWLGTSLTPPALAEEATIIQDAPSPAGVNIENG